MKKLVFILLTAVVVAFTSCIKESVAPIIPNTSGEVSLTLVTPSKFDAGLTRVQLPQADENEISSVTVIVFDWWYDYHKTSTSITHVGGNVDVRVNLRTDTKAYSLYVFTNLSDYLTDAQITAALTGATIDNAYERLRMAALTKDGWDQSKFVMSAVWRNFTLTPYMTTLSPFYLMRSLASVDVGLKWDSATKVWTGLDNFELEEVYVYNANADYTVLPKIAAYESKPYKKVLLPTIYNFSTTTNGEASSIGNTAASALHYDSNNITIAGTALNNSGNGQHLASKIYLAEVENTATTPDSARPAIIVKGIWDGVSYYYKLDFSSKNPDGTLKDRLSILRNYKYRFNIIKVQGPGHRTPDEAFESSSLNIVSEVLEWEDVNMGDITFDNQNFLAVNKSVFELDRDPKIVAGSTNTLTIRTDVSAGWSTTIWADEAGVTAIPNDSSTGQPWLSLSANSGTGSGSGDNTGLLMPLNQSGAARTAWVHIKAGRLNYKVKVTQTLIAPFYLDITSPLESIIEIAPGVGVVLPDINVNIEWEPYGRPVSWEIKKVNATGVSFPTTSGTIPAQGVGPGVSTITLQPESMLAADIDPALGGDPYAERISRLEVRLEQENGELIVRNAVLKQTNYHIEATPATYYYTNGNTVSLTVRSNCDWEAVLLTTDAVVSVDQSVHTGSKSGTTLSFTMANHAITISQSIIEIRPLNPAVPPIQVTIKGVGGLIYNYGGVDYVAETANRKRGWGYIEGNPSAPCPAGYFVPTAYHYAALDAAHNLPAAILGGPSFDESCDNSYWYHKVLSWNTATNQTQYTEPAGKASVKFFYTHWTISESSPGYYDMSTINLYGSGIVGVHKSRLTAAHPNAQGDSWGNTWLPMREHSNFLYAALRDKGYARYYVDANDSPNFRNKYIYHANAGEKFGSWSSYATDDVRCVTKLPL